MKLNYYARLNDKNVAIEIISTPKDLRGVKGYVSIPEFNSTLIYKEYNERTGWSEETFEPTVDTTIQKRLGELEDDNIKLKEANEHLTNVIDEMIKGVK